MDQSLKHAKEKIIRISRLFAFISKINQKIARLKDKESLFKNVCQIAIKHGEFKMAWIGIPDGAYKKIKLVEQRGMSAEDVRMFFDISQPDIGFQEIILGKSTYYVCNNIEHDFPLENMKPFMADRGLLSCMIVPIKKKDKIIGTFNLFASELNYFKKEEIALLVTMTKDISFALDLFEKAKKQKEQLILQHENRFRFLIEKSTEINTISCKEGKIVYGSPSIKKILGYTKEEYLNKYPQNLIHPEDLKEYLKKRNKTSQKLGGSFHFEHRRLHKNGSWIWCDGTVTNHFNVPQLNGLVSNFRDISEKKLNDIEKEFDKNNLHALINNTKDLMWSVDKDFHLITSNERFDEAMKLNLGKIITKRTNILSTLLNPEQRKRYKIFYKRAFTGDTFTEVEYTNSPIEIWSEISFYPIFKGKEVIGTACHSQDITERKKTETLLRKSETFNLGVLNSLSAHIAVIDTFGSIIATNDVWEQFAFNNGEATLLRTGVGSNYFEVCRKSAESGDEVASDTLKGMMDVLQGKKNDFYLEYPCHAPNEQRWFGMRVKRFESDNAMLVVTHVNITERKLAVDELMGTSNKLQLALNDITKIMDSSLDVICAVDAKGNFLKVSAASEAVWGYKPEELIGKPLINFVYHEDSENTQLTADNVMTGNDLMHFENRYVRKDGTLVPIEWSARWDEKHQVRYGIARDVTEKKRLEKAFEIERQQFFDLFTEAPSGMGVLIGPNHRFEMANPPYLKLIGKKNIIGQLVKDVLPEVEEQGFIEMLDKVYKTGKAFSANEMLVKLDINSSGEPVDRYLNFLYQPHIGNGGKTDKILFFAVDVSEQVLSRKRIEESEARLNEAQTISKMGNWEMDLNTHSVIWSDEIFRIFEIDMDNHKPSHSNFLEYVHHKDRTEVDLVFKSSFENSSINVFEHRIVTTSLKVKVIEQRWKILKDNNGNPTRAIGTCQDITESKRIKQELELTQFVFDHASDAIFWMSSDAKIVNVNEAASNSLGYTRKELLSLSVPDIDPDFNIELWSTFFPELREKHSISIETTQLRKDGSSFPVEIRSNYIKFGDKEFSCAFVRDISERKIVEQNLERQHRELQKTNTELDRFVYSASHDLRAPLASLLGLIDMTTDDIDSSNSLQMEYMGMMRQSVLKLDNFIEDILNYSRNARTELEKDNIVFEEMVQEAFVKHEFMDENNEFKLNVDVKQATEFISDKRRISVILNNLISNAIKYKDAAKEKSFVNVSILSDKNSATIIIEDNGIGIAVKDTAKIFEMFYRASTQSTGSGLGLYIVKETIDKLKGNIIIESEKSVGSKFTITILNLNNHENNNYITD
ncbi:PAS domain S-box protein [Thalassobellus suaedae]|uniref:histidine kinase n=1 Tax=Thalassobellus suaedae TaxID=3074124 RepID=A0ABY9Y833_9FLAO|nr:PAS domain S-box protein [Flavobacteriaceae bacterium HL-DH10]